VRGSLREDYIHVNDRQKEEEEAEKEEAEKEEIDKIDL
jgi:hypothetical protein